MLGPGWRASPPASVRLDAGCPGLAAPPANGSAAAPVEAPWGPPADEADADGSGLCLRAALQSAGAPGVRFSSREPFGGHAEALELWLYVSREGWDAALGDVGIAQNETAFTTARDLCDPATLTVAGEEPAEEVRAGGERTKKKGGGGAGKKKRAGKRGSGGGRPVEVSAVDAAVEGMSAADAVEALCPTVRFFAGPVGSERPAASGVAAWSPLVLELQADLEPAGGGAPGPAASRPSPCRSSRWRRMCARGSGPGSSSRSVRAAGAAGTPGTM